MRPRDLTPDPLAHCLGQLLTLDLLVGQSKRQAGLRLPSCLQPLGLPHSWSCSPPPAQASTPQGKGAHEVCPGCRWGTHLSGAATGALEFWPLCRSGFGEPGLPLDFRSREPGQCRTR